MKINHTYSPEAGVRIELCGELRHHEAIRAMSRIKEIVAVHLPKSLEISLAGVSFMDSSGIAVVAQAQKLCSQNEGALKITGAQKQARKVFKASGITKIVDFREGT